MATPYAGVNWKARVTCTGAQDGFLSVAGFADHGGHGLRGMRERVNLVNGQLLVRPTPEGGYLVEATIPAEVDQKAVRT